MEISLRQLSKRYNREWIFKELSYELKAGESYAITGANGSGKSTLLQIISGYALPSAGLIEYRIGEDEIPAEEIYRYLTVATPYMELIEDFTLQEHLLFHYKFRRIRKPHTIEDIMKSSYLYDSRNKAVKNFSSGMKQRLKLALAFYTECELTLLDEPTSNLDQQGIEWYQLRMDELLTTGTMVIIASNQKYEYEKFCTTEINIHDFKA